MELVFGQTHGHTDTWTAAAEGQTDVEVEKKQGKLRIKSIVCDQKINVYLTGRLRNSSGLCLPFFLRYEHMSCTIVS